MSYSVEIMNIDPDQRPDIVTILDIGTLLDTTFNAELCGKVLFI